MLPSYFSRSHLEVCHLMHESCMLRLCAADRTILGTVMSNDLPVTHDNVSNVALQIHWPDRYLPLFGQGAYDPEKERHDEVPFEEQLQGLDDVIRAGKARHPSWMLHENELRKSYVSLCMMTST